MNHPCEVEAWPVHAIRRVGIGDVECLSPVQKGKVLRTRGWNTAVKPIERCTLTTNYVKDYTWRTCSKNHAGRWLVSATSGGKHRIAFSPKEDIRVNLSEHLSVTTLPNRCRAHRSLSMSISRGSTALIIRSRCLRTDLRTPSSNSWSKSTTRIGYNLNPKGDNRSQKEF